MWQVVSGTANLLNDCDLQAVVRTVAGDGTPHVLHTGWLTRTPGQPCPGNATNAAMEVLGDRWSLMVLHDVMFGNRQRAPVG
jgi:hypothetical protein